MVCPACRDVFVKISEPKCRHCGKALPDADAEYCTDCGKRTYSYYEEGRALWFYDERTRESLARFKYGGRREYAAFYARMLVDNLGGWIAAKRADALVPVPIHKSRLRTRGYNQAEELAAELAMLTQIPVLSEYLLRKKDTAAQKDLGNKERRENLHDAFLIQERAKELCNPPSCVIIIDDIYTTGNTVEACAKVLHQSGVDRIYYVSLCIGRV